MKNAIEIRDLRKEYKRQRQKLVAIHDLSLAVPPGTVWGLLGPNGSGKTSTLRCLIGLAKPTEGSCWLLDRDCQSELARVIRRVGSVVEKPAFLSSFSGRRHLELLGRLYGIGSTAVGDVLELVGLADRGDDPVGSYSLGMLHRLGIAAALLKGPDVLILDEPANGLDPAGIVEIRGMMRTLAAEGRTVLVASHLLSEVELACDGISILSKGRTVYTGTVSDLLASTGAGGIVARVGDADHGLEALGRAGIAATKQSNELLEITLLPGDGAQVSRVLAAAGIYPLELRPVKATLEAAFLKLTTGESSAEQP